MVRRRLVGFCSVPFNLATETVFTIALLPALQPEKSPCKRP